jgi:hypothetical protein
MKELDHIGLYVNDVLRYSKVFDANIHFLHIMEGRRAHLPAGKGDLAKLKQLIEGSDKHVFHILHGRDVLCLIEEYTQKNNVQLVFVVRHHHYFLDSLFHRDLSEKISLRSKIPILVMKEKSG